ncbi:MAG: M36 family metallopeptidase [Desulfobacterales bacterium]
MPVPPGQVGSSSKMGAWAARKGRFEAFNAMHGNRWKANLSKKDGRVKILYGNLSRSYPGDPERVAFGFIKDCNSLFGMKDASKELRTTTVDRTHDRHHVRLQQTYDNLPVSGAFVLVHATDGGQVSMVQNDYIEDLRVENERIVTREEAVEIVVADLQARLEDEATVSPANAVEMVAPYADSHRFIWKVTAPVRNPFGLWVYHIDAESSEILYAANEITSLKNGKGKVYKTNGAWHEDQIKGSSLKNMFTRSEGYSEGWLWGLHSDIYDYNSNDPFSPTFKFNYDPDLPAEKPWFDATTAYFQMNRLWDWWRKKVLKRYGPASPDYFYTLSIPVVVNVDDFCNAIYTSDLGSGIPGLAFGNEGSCSAFSEDLILDLGVLSHEYTHAMMDWVGFDAQFGGEINQYGRAMGEGNADWFAYLFTKTPLMGEVAWDWTSKGYLRNLNNTRVYPDDVDHPSLGTPEEHYTGEIWGGYLYDLSRVLKSKALKFVYQGLFYFTPTGGHRPNHPDFFDAIYAQILAEQDLNGGKSQNAFKAWGAMAGRGINAAIRKPYSHSSDYFGTGSTGSDEVAYFTWSFPQNKRIKTKGRILSASDRYEFPVSITVAGKTLTVTAKAIVDAGMRDVQIRTVDNRSVIAGNPTITKSTAYNAAAAELHVTDIPPGDYVILLSGDRGDYSLNVSLK